ncbi:MAG: hypothetical protein K6B52_06140 [Clostridiales bacterium]|nr:hypothetical protein [Clostridiales bacterium]
MKKTIRAVFFLLIILSLTSCGNTDKSKNITAQGGKTVNDVLSSAAAQPSTAPAVKSDAYVEKLSLFSNKIPDGSKFDVDLTTLNSSMVYARVSDMVTNPKEYSGKSVKMSGTYTVYETEARNYYACIISDATACCSQGLEFLPVKELKYPDDYPPVGTGITVTGIFDIYYEGSKEYYQLKDAYVYYGQE